MRFGHRLAATFSRFTRNKKGNAALLFGLSAFILISAIGGAVDFGMELKQKAFVQDALDQSTLAAAISSNDDPTAMQTLAVNEFKRDMAANNITTATVTTFNYDSTNRALTTTAAVTYKPYLLGLFGFTTLNYTVTTKTNRVADGMLELALVLDNTWSMSQILDGSQTKIQVLKTAASGLVSSIMTPANKPYVKVSVVPYADYVNVGIANRSQSWVSVGADYSTTSTQTCQTLTTKTQCTGGTLGTCNGVQDGVPYTYSCWIVAQVCQVVTVAPYQSCSGGGTTNYKFYGCVKNIMVSNVLQMPDPLTAYTGILQTSQTCLNPIQPLTNDSTVISTAVNNLVVNVGSYKPETYIPSGLIWGVNVLSPPAPFTDGAAYDTNNKVPRKAIVLMTDGSNTLYANSTGGIAAANATQLATTYTNQDSVCTYAKNKKIEVYTIGFGVTDATALAHLKSCATDPAHYFDAKSSADLIAAFKTIGGALSKVRISQ